MQFKLVRTCYACPEQYDVVNRDNEEEKIAYLRLRHGTFRAEYPYDDGKIVYESCPEGDGIFMDDERAVEIGKALLAVRAAMTEEMARAEYAAAMIGVVEERMMTVEEIEAGIESFKTLLNSKKSDS